MRWQKEHLVTLLDTNVQISEKTSSEPEVLNSSEIQPWICMR